MKKYSLTEEHKQEFDRIKNFWIQNALSTKQISEEEKELCKDAVENLYRAANLVPPPRHRIVFAPSPFAARFAAGFAAAIWYSRKNGEVVDDATDAATYAAIAAATRTAIDDATDAATRAATSAATRDAIENATDDAIRDATDAATLAATRAATLAATRDATDDATDAATRDAIRAATYDATDDATRDAIRAATDAATRDAIRAATAVATAAATDNATYAATDDATYAATLSDTNKNFIFNENLKLISKKLGINSFGLECAKKVWKFYQGGNTWSGNSAFFDFFKNVAKLKIDWSKWEPYEYLSRHTGFRFVHKEFCILSELPIKLETAFTNGIYQPHCEGAPYIQWKDGSGIYALNGVRVPRWLAETPSGQLKPEDYSRIQNADVKVEFLKKIGIERMLERGKLVDTYNKHSNPQWIVSEYELYDMSLIIEGVPYAPYLKMTNPTTGVFHVEGVHPDCRNIEDAIKFRCGGKNVKFFANK